MPTKYRYKVLTGVLRLRVRDIYRQVCCENEVEVLRGVLSSDHVHMFVSVPSKLAISDLVRKVKGRSSFKVQREFPAIRKHCAFKSLIGIGQCLSAFVLARSGTLPSQFTQRLVLCLPRTLSFTAFYLSHGQEAFIADAWQVVGRKVSKVCVVRVFGSKGGLN